MSKVVAILTLIFCCLSMTTASAQFSHIFRANMDAEQVVGGAGSNSDATAEGIFCLSDSADEMSMEFTFDGFTTDDIFGMHIRLGLPGANGPLLFGLVNPMNDVDDFVDLITGVTSIWDPGDSGASLLSQLNSLQEGRLYVVVFTNEFLNGEVRGQILPVLMGDLNQDGEKDLNDIEMFVESLSSGEYILEADFDKNGTVDLVDINPFVDALANGCL